MFMSSFIIIIVVFRFPYSQAGKIYCHLNSKDIFIFYPFDKTFRMPLGYQNSLKNKDNFELLSEFGTYWNLGAIFII